MKLAIILINGAFRVHNAQCRDVGIEARRYGEPAESVELDTRHAVNAHCWGDVAENYADEGTPEWHAECDAQGDAFGGTVFLPCCSTLPEV